MRRVGSRWRRRIKRSGVVGLKELPWSLHSAAGAPNYGTQENAGRSGRDDSLRTQPRAKRRFRNYQSD